MCKYVAMSVYLIHVNVYRIMSLVYVHWYLNIGVLQKVCAYFHHILLLTYIQGDIEKVHGGLRPFQKSFCNAIRTYHFEIYLYVLMFGQICHVMSLHNVPLYMVSPFWQVLDLLQLCTNGIRMCIMTVYASTHVMCLHMHHTSIVMSCVLPCSKYTCIPSWHLKLGSCTDKSLLWSSISFQKLIDTLSANVWKGIFPTFQRNFMALFAFV